MKTTAEMIAVMQAHADGRLVEARIKPAIGKWDPTPEPTWNWGSNDYRIAPIPKPTPMTIPWDVLSRDIRGAARDASGCVCAFQEKPEVSNHVWRGLGSPINGVINGIDPGTCDWRDSWIENPLYEGERA